MLRGLSVRDMLLIDHLDLEFQPGLNVLTGETGAGKSILLDSLGFALGWRGRADLVREGAALGEVTAGFDLPADHPAFAVLDQAGLPHDGELILRRTVNADGRKQAYVNDRRCSGEILRQLSETLVELHGQQDDRGLLNPRVHRALLDQFAGAGGALANVREAWQAMSGAKKALQERRDALAAMERDADYLRHAVAELDQLDPAPGEEAQLDSERRLMQAAERIREDIARAAQAMGEGGAEGLMRDAARWLEGASAQAENRLDAPLEALSRAAEELDQALRGVEDCLSALEFDTTALEQAEERLFAIRALARKHSVAPDNLGDFAEDLRARLAALDSGAAEIPRLEQAVRAASAGYDKEAASLSALRRKAAAALDTAMAAELAPLKMERAVFTTELGAAPDGPEGRDAVQFVVSTNPGAPSGPLNKIASGGELSRFLLALKVCLKGDAEGITMIFDEIDRGVGGATADAVGRRLAALAQAGQVLIVTHSPQVAALGGHHWLVQKSVKGAVTSTIIAPVTGEARTEEIARMLAGDRITDEARAAAAALMQAV
ncbi:MAG: DNA repair protein RecN [Rhodobacteraceae bacterium]|nr:DNA repair protein RecN [Paracoccaceae bacterium]